MPRTNKALNDRQTLRSDRVAFTKQYVNKLIILKLIKASILHGYIIVYSFFKKTASFAI